MRLLLFGTQGRDLDFVSSRLLMVRVWFGCRLFAEAAWIQPKPFVKKMRQPVCRTYSAFFCDLRERGVRLLQLALCSFKAAIEDCFVDWFAGHLLEPEIEEPSGSPDMFYYVIDGYPTGGIGAYERQ